jgi:hypothetical protein
MSVKRIDRRETPLGLHAEEAGCSPVRLQKPRMNGGMSGRMERPIEKQTFFEDIMPDSGRKRGSETSARQH